MPSPVSLQGVNVYVGDIHGCRLSHLSAALATLGIEPAGLLCTMDLDQVLAIRELRELEKRYTERGRTALLVPGNHEAAIVHGIGIDSATYRQARQDTTIFELIEKINLPDFAELRAYVERKLALVGGQPMLLDAAGEYPALLIHAALSGRQERYIDEFPAPLQAHVRERTDLWLRLVERAHIDANFDAMKKRGLHTMVRGHDHYTALRSVGDDGVLCGHQLVIQRISAAGECGYVTESVRSDDTPDDMAFVDPARFASTRDAGGIYWHELLPERRYVVNFGPYYSGFFGLLRAGDAQTPPALAFCRTDVSFYTADDRRHELHHFTLAQRAAAGANFYTLFPRE